jgi:O-antigen/teichoic acid export membrane protein
MSDDESSLKTRYLSKLVASLIAMAISLVTATIIPRVLGPAAFGNFEFLTSFFTRVINFLNMGSSNAFYTKLSQRPRDFGLVSFYLTSCGLVLLLFIFFCVGLNVLNIHTYLWPDQVPLYIYLGVVWGVLSFISQVFGKMADAYGLTVHAEFLKVLQRALGLAIIIGLFLTEELDLTTLFLYHFFILSFFSVSLVFLFSRSKFSLFQNWRLSFIQIRKYFREFFDYCHPLVVYAFVVLIVGILDRWLLQYFSGSVQQGFFGLGFKIGAICFIFTSAMTPLIHREYAIAYEKKDLIEMARLFRRYIPLLYAIAAYFSCFIAIEAEKVTYIFGGDEFQSAALVVTVLAFYPIHQTYGQLSGAVFMATGQTKLRRNIGSFFQLIGLPTTYFLVAPVDQFGLDAGAVGLAAKIVILQFLAVNVQLFFNARLLDLKYLRYIAHQIGCFASLISLAYIASSIVDNLMIHFSMITRFFISGIFYTGLVMVLGLIFPIVFGLNRHHVSQFKQFIINKLFQT